MKGFLVIVILAGIGAAWYYTPVRHHQAAKGTYFLRQYISFTTSNGVTGWLAGQEIHEAPGAPLVQGSKTVTDGTFMAVVPEAILTQDIEDAEALRLADNITQESARNDAAALTVQYDDQAHAAQLASAQNPGSVGAPRVVGSVGSTYDAPTRAVGGGPSSAIYYDHPTVPAAGSPRVASLSQTASRQAASVEPRFVSVPRSTPKPSGLAR